MVHVEQSAGKNLDLSIFGKPVPEFCIFIAKASEPLVEPPDLPVKLWLDPNASTGRLLKRLTSVLVLRKRARRDSVQDSLFGGRAVEVRYLGVRPKCALARLHCVQAAAE